MVQGAIKVAAFEEASAGWADGRRRRRRGEGGVGRTNTKGCLECTHNSVQRSFSKKPRLLDGREGGREGGTKAAHTVYSRLMLWGLGV